MIQFSNDGFPCTINLTCASITCRRITTHRLMEDNKKLIKNENDIEAEGKNWLPYVPRRYILTFLIFLGTANSFTVRVNFNVALVAMVNNTGDDGATNSTIGECPGPAAVSNNTRKAGEFTWSPALQSLLLASYYYGYPVTQPLGGYLADRFGAKWLIASTGITSGIVNLLLPTVASWNPYALIVLRTILGLGQGPLWPALSAMLASWTPRSERTRLYAICNGGSLLGTVLSQSLSGILCDSDFLGGWRAAFYVFGVTSLLWSATFILLTTDCPSTHPNISEGEKQMILDNIGDTKYISPPWRKIFTSKAFLAFAFILFMDGIAYDIIFIFLPLYMKRVLKYDISQSGVLASVPYITAFAVSFLAGYSSDVLWNKKIMSPIWVRRLFTILGEMLQAGIVVLISLLGCDKVAVIICFIITVSFSGISCGGFAVNVFDIAPRYAGGLYGVANGISNLGGVIGPLAVGALTNVSGNVDSWKMVFYMVAGFYALGCFVFCVFGSADIQPWANPSTPDPSAESKNEEHKEVGNIN